VTKEDFKVESDEIMVVKCINKEFDLDERKLSKCCVSNNFDYMLDLFDLNHHKDLMVEFIDTFPFV